MQAAAETGKPAGSLLFFLKHEKPLQGGREYGKMGGNSEKSGF